MRISSARRGGLVAALALTAGSLALAAGPATAAAALCEPVGTVMVNPNTVMSGGKVAVSWKASGTAGCPITSERMSGPGFDGDETVPASGTRTVQITQDGPSVASWTLSAANSGGETELYSKSVTVTQYTVNGLGGAALAFPDDSGTETKVETHARVPGRGAPVSPGTRVALANVGSDYQAAYQGTNGDLWVVAPSGAAADTGLGMAAGTSPSLTATGPDTYTVAFQANNSVLWTYSPATGGRSTGFGMAAGSSPAVTFTSAGVAIAYADQNGNLDVIDPVSGWGGLGTPHAPVAPGTSPAITYVPGQKGAYEIAYQAPDHSVRTADWGHAQTFPTTITAAYGTSPAITTLPSGEIDIAANGVEGWTWVLDPGGSAFINGSGYQPGTSPAVAPAAGGGWVVAWTDPGNTLVTSLDGVGPNRTGLIPYPGASPALAQITGTAR
ncbi:hypothetical protein ABT095_18180 [Kitasatospora sp. NPDC002227]|uniref:hypothetical protein n=1 Tax=Kitasatospora sp. NPDC002227 TaxID=3154773 RepID=UPI003334228D